MKEIFRSNNPVQLSYVESVLQDHGMETIRLDQHTSMIEGSINAIQCRIMVLDEDHDRALDIVKDIKSKL